MHSTVLLKFICLSFIVTSGTHIILSLSPSLSLSLCHCASLRLCLSIRLPPLSLYGTLCLCHCLSLSLSLPFQCLSLCPSCISPQYLCAIALSLSLYVSLWVPLPFVLGIYVLLLSYQYGAAENISHPSHSFSSSAFKHHRGRSEWEELVWDKSVGRKK